MNRPETLFHVQSHTGIPLVVRLIGQNDAYGRNRCLTHSDVEPLVEFLDARQAGNPFADPLGLFISRYNTSTLVQHPSGRGLCLEGAEHSWDVPAPGMASVIAWLKTAMTPEQRLATERSIETDQNLADAMRGRRERTSMG